MEFDEIYRQYGQKVKAFILAMVRDEMTAEDLLQETFIRVKSHMECLRDETKQIPWIFRIACNLCRDHFRASARDARLSETALAHTPQKAGTTIQERIEQQEMGRCVRQKMDRLPESHRTILILYDVMAFHHHEIALILNISVDNAKVRLHRARRQLKEILETECRFQVDDRQVLVCEPLPYTPQ